MAQIIGDVYYAIIDGQDGSASIHFFESAEARDLYEEKRQGEWILGTGTIDQSDIDAATTLEEVENDDDDEY